MITLMLMIILIYELELCAGHHAGCLVQLFLYEMLLSSSFFLDEETEPHKRKRFAQDSDMADSKYGTFI